MGGITNSGTISAGSDGIFIGAKLDATASFTLSTFAGAISNAGAISGANGIVIGSGVTFAAGSDIINSGSITGTTAAIDVSAATSPVTIDQQAGTINGAILLSASGDTLNIAGGIVNGDVVGQAASGTVNIAPGAGNAFVFANTIAGVAAVNVNSGTFFDGGTISATSLNVNAGGTLAPGAPGALGTLTVVGNVAFQGGSTYLVAINGATASATSINGSATLNGATLALANGAKFNVGQTYTIMTASGGVSGQFTSGITLGSLYRARVTYDPDDVLLTIGFNQLAPLLPANAPVNVVNVTHAIDTFILNGGTLPAGFSSLFNYSTAQIDNALSQLSGEVATGAQLSGFQLMTSFMTLLLDPLGGGAAPGGSAGIGPLPFAPDQPTATEEIAASAYAAMLKAPQKAPDVPISQYGPWRTWGAAFGGSSSLTGDAVVTGSRDVRTTAGGFAAGLDYRVSPDTVLGIALAGAGTGWDLSGGGGSGHSDAFQAGLYAKHQLGAAYLSGALVFANYWTSTTRTVTVAGTDTLKADFNA
jgi:uncharacterized protein with beta-barrel porin domain